MLTSLLTFCSSYKFICRDLEQRSIFSIGYIFVFHFRTFVYKGFKTQFLSLYSDKNLCFKALTLSILVKSFRSTVLTYVTRNVTGLCVLMRKWSKNGSETKNAVFYLGFHFWNEKNISCETIRSTQRFQQK